MKRICAIIVLILGSSLIIASLFEEREIDQQVNNLSKPMARGPDVGYALLTKGELVNCYMNMGQISDSYFQTVFYNFNWPQSKGSIPNKVECTDDLAFVFAHNGNVIDGHTGNWIEDWGAVAGHSGRYHANPQPDELKVQGYPHLAASDIVETWPEGYDDSTGNFVPTPGERHWPGTYRIDINPVSPTYMQQIPGEFPADRVVFSAVDDHDNLQNKPLGIRLDTQVYEYGRPYAADFQFYETVITNTSNNYLEECWYGYYLDIDYGEYTREAIYTYSTGTTPGPWDVMYTFTPNITDPNELETGIFGFAVLETPENLGITDDHYLPDADPPIPANDHEMWAVITSQPNLLPNYLLPSDFFHGSDVHHDDYSATQTSLGTDWSVFVMTGPFNLVPGESVRSILVVCAGENVDDFKANIDMAKEMKEKYFQGPSGPQAPKLYAVPGDGEITLYWTDKPEKTADPFSGEYDFEGYKIYRSVDDGQTWGDQIVDGKGNLVGYVPVAYFDLQNGISGLDPLNSTFYLGDDKGLVHTWKDSDVHNGVIYSYTITSYDRGDPTKNIQAFESSKGKKETELNFVKVTPKPKAIGFTDPQVSYEHTTGLGKGYIEISVVDPWALTDHLYQIVFDDSPAVAFNVVEVIEGQQVSRLSDFPINTSDMPVVDGFQVRLNGDDQFGGVSSFLDEYDRDVSSEDLTDTTGSWYVISGAHLQPAGSFETRTSDYEIRFTSQGSKIGTRLAPMVEIRQEVPFEVWNTTMNQQVTAVVADDGDGIYEEGEEISILNLAYPDLDIGQTFSVDLLEVAHYKIKIMNAPGDDTLQPMEGQKVQVITKRAHTPQDRYELSFLAHTFKPASAQSLNEIRVVPNPYVVNATWEQSVNVRRLQFMYLPPKCTISIYTTRGELVTTLEHNDETGSKDWNLTAQSGQEVAYGIYIYVVKTPEGEEYISKFALIK
jgi:hypothetical protein